MAAEPDRTAGVELKFNAELAEYERTEKPMTIETLLAPIELIALRKGREEESRQLVLRLLRRRVGELPTAIATQVQALPVESLEQLGEDLLDFASLADLEHWLARHSQSRTAPQ